MPIHDWARVSAGVFHDFHHGWAGRLKSVLNEEMLPRPFYAIVEPSLGESATSWTSNLQDRVGADGAAPSRRGHARIHVEGGASSPPPPSLM